MIRWPAESTRVYHKGANAMMTGFIAEKERVVWIYNSMMG